MEILEKFKNLIEEHFINEHEIAFYEKELGVKPKYLSKLSKKQNSLPPCQLLLQKQINYSQHLLKTTSKTIKEIAQEMNFEDPYYFSKVFKKKTGMSPTEYRQINQ
ncbi:AraC family transcriptional regulator [Wenyingzhuangia sp. 2_MG-2023]|uniref:helix-turn-helix domain-containing protein n=1 Tax=Wenyingzhuangia sp. 2_MG-2023 TaxID=3062639 RepID=UPI0026E25A6A|nr:AraC family transcriptional regulator [Wenyingzhuangia sp. 2_MG-2023]MDO6739136.1 AraC family transcriptional regulator [Wenyingzhuangia sp. 2_MG-2023]MDO6803581.1 AraC family transcriptional regulator [Wenyingzhuangia sp. 1_MG-2023]